MTDIRQHYKWTGINRKGKRLSGVIQAEDAKEAEAELRNMDVDVISLAVKKTSSFSLFRKRVRPKEIVLFTRYLATMLTAGLPILQSLEVIARDQENETLKSVVNAIRSSISAGSTFADSLAKYPQYFSDLYINLVRAGEKSATLDKVLGRLARYLEKIERIKSKIKSAMIYPCTILSVAVGVSLILLLFVVPQFQTMFENAHAQLPAFTRMVISFSNFLRSYWWILILVIGFSIYFFIRVKRTNERFSFWIDQFMLKLWIIGPILQKAIIARFTRTLSITLDAGLPIVESMRTMSTIMGNKIYNEGIGEICEDITNGTALTTAMDRTKLFPNMVIQMVSVGESSGMLGEMLNNIAGYYEDEVDSISENLSTLLEPAIIVILGVIIGVFVIAMYLPIFKLGSTI